MWQDMATIQMSVFSKGDVLICLALYSTTSRSSDLPLGGDKSYFKNRYF